MSGPVASPAPQSFLFGASHRQSASAPASESPEGGHCSTPPAVVCSVVVFSSAGSWANHFRDLDIAEVAAAKSMSRNMLQMFGKQAASLGP